MSKMKEPARLLQRNCLSHISSAQCLLQMGEDGEPSTLIQFPGLESSFNSKLSCFRSHKAYFGSCFELFSCHGTSAMHLLQKYFSCIVY